jgi:hypothetical protein
MKLLRLLLLNETMIVTYIIVSYCLAMCAVVIVASYYIYNERYGISFADFLRMNF